MAYDEFIYFIKTHLLKLQSLIDLVVSVILLTSTLTVTDTHTLHNDGILGEIECRLWNTKLFLWGFFISSTWNMVSLTFER